MVYLAILLILCGLLILITALSAETGKLAADGDNIFFGLKKSAESDSGDSAVEDVDIIFPGDKQGEINEHSDNEDIFISFEDETADFNEFETVPEIDYNHGKISVSENNQLKRESFQNERRKLDSEGRPAIIEKRENAAVLRNEAIDYVSAIMFDDRSNIIDYESGEGVIDSTFSKYKSIKRIGKGKIESDYDGVNFYLDEKLYRFDFHKVYDIWSGANYVALPLKGSSTVKLFIIENSAGFPCKVEADFKEYEKGL